LSRSLVSAPSAARPAGTGGLLRGQRLGDVYTSLTSGRPNSPRWPPGAVGRDRQARPSGLS